MKIFWIVLLLVLVLLIAIVLIRTLMTGKKSSRYFFDSDPDKEQMLAHKLSAMVQCETISHRGEEDPDKFRKMHAVMKEQFPLVFETCEVMDLDGNLLLKWKGKSDKRPVMLMSHIDVVPAGDGWTKDPFGGEISDGKVWGRGTADTKGSVMAFYQAAQELMESGFVPKQDVYLCSSCTEEIAGNGAGKIVAWLKEHNVHLAMLCDEGGGIVSNPMAGVSGQFAMLGVFEKGHGDVKFIARSHGGHSAAPPKNTPLVRLGAFMNDIEKHGCMDVEFEPAVKAMLTTLAPYSSFGLKLVFANLWLFEPLLKKVLPALSPQAAAMLQTTVAFTRAQGSDGFNVIPQEAWVSANMRFIPHQKAKESVEAISRVAEKYGLETEILELSDPSPAVDIESKQFQLALKTIEKTFPTLAGIPYVVTGGTDCRFYNDVSDACIRFAPLVYGPEQMEGMHGLDENIETNCLCGAVEYYKNLLSLLKGTEL